MEQENSQFKKPRRYLNEDTSHQRNRPPSSAATSSNSTFVVPRNGAANASSANLDASAVLRQIDDATSSNLSLFKNARKVVDPNAPEFPSWTRERIFLNRNYLFLKSVQQQDTSQQSLPIPSLNAKVQEFVIIEELLNALVGVAGGQFIYAEEILPNMDYRTQNSTTIHDVNRVEFKIREEFNSSIVEIAKQVLKLAKHYIRVSELVDTHSQYQYGLVNHALSASLRSLVKEYLLMVAQLENQFKQKKLTLQKLWFYLQPALKTFEVLDKLCMEIFHTKVTGGNLLNLIYKRSQVLSGDKQIEKLFKFLLENASVPYFEMLERWIYNGVIEDPYSEFMVEENKSLTKENLTKDHNDTYWESRYTLRQQQIPIFLEEVGEKILLSGKYLNVIRECKMEIEYPFADRILFTFYERDFVEKIEKAFQYASKQLIDLIYVKSKLLDRLKSVKHFLLLDQGDLFVHFMDIAEEELQKNISEISKTKLDSLLELALRTSIAVSDPYKENVVCELLPFNLPNYLHQISKLASVTGKDILAVATSGVAGKKGNPIGYEAFTLDYRVEWPLSLIVNRNCINKYQIIFRHLFYCKYIERQLCNAWIRQKYTKELSVGSHFSSLYVLRQRMLQFLQSFCYYMTVEVIEKNFHLMEEKLKELFKSSNSTIDHFMNTHQDFLDVCLKACLLSTHSKEAVSLFQNLYKILATCVNFSKYAIQFTDSLTLNDGDLIDKIEQQHASQEKTTFSVRKHRNNVLSMHAKKNALDNNHIAMITHFAKDFDSTLKELLTLLQRLSHTSTADMYMSVLFNRLDFNHFYYKKEVE